MEYSDSDTIKSFDIRAKSEIKAFEDERMLVKERFEECVEQLDRYQKLMTKNELIENLV